MGWGVFIKQRVEVGGGWTGGWAGGWVRVLLA